MSYVKDGYFKYASVMDMMDETRPIRTTFEDTTPGLEAKRRRKREIGEIRGAPPEGCKYVFADGTRDARNGKELSIQEKFFQLQEAGIKDFVIKLNITKKVKVLSVFFSAGGGLRTGNSMPVLTAHFPVLAYAILAGLFVAAPLEEYLTGLSGSSTRAGTGCAKIAA